MYRLITLLLIMSNLTSAQDIINTSPTEFLSDRWIHVTNDKGETKTEEHENETVFCLQRNEDDAQGAIISLLKGVKFTNGIIECDIFSPVPKGNLSFIGIVFRANELQYECVYFRPFISNKIGAIQYIPIVKDGIINWWEYTDEAYKGTAQIPQQEWFHIKLEVNNAQLKIFVDHNNEPQLVINTLGLGVKEGMVGLWLGNSRKAFFKNLKITTLHAASD